MARSIDDIRQQIKDRFVAEMNAIGAASDPTTWGMYNRRRIWVNITAFCIWFLETLFDVYKGDVNTTLANLKPTNLSWYVQHVKAFQSGFPLLADSDQFDNTGYTDDQVAASKIIAYAAVVKQLDAFGHGFLRFKLAKANGDDLTQLTADEKTAVALYIEKTGACDDDFVVESNTPDDIKQSWVIYYNPLILNNTGARIDGSANTPVQDAIKAYLFVLTFGVGVYDTQKHIDAVQAVEGVVEPDLQLCQVRYGSRPYANVNVFYTPDAGYLRFPTEDDLQIEFIANNG